MHGNEGSENSSEHKAMQRGNGLTLDQWGQTHIWGRQIREQSLVCSLQQASELQNQKVEVLKPGTHEDPS